MSKLVIFGRTGCPHTEASLSKAQLDQQEHIFIEVKKCPDDSMCKIFRMMAGEKEHRTVPLIFKVDYIGGNDQYSSID